MQIHNDENFEFNWKERKEAKGEAFHNLICALLVALPWGMANRVQAWPARLRISGDKLCLCFLLCFRSRVGKTICFPRRARQRMKVFCLSIIMINWGRCLIENTLFSFPIEKEWRGAECEWTDELRRLCEWRWFRTWTFCFESRSSTWETETR